MFFLQRKIRTVCCCFMMLVGLFGVWGNAIALEAPSKDKSEVNRTRGTEAQQSNLTKLNKLSDTMYQKAEQGDPLATLQDLRAMQGLLVQVPLKEMTTPEGIDALIQTIDHAINVFSMFRFQPESGIEAAAQVRYATDALTHKLHPLWNEAYGAIVDDLRVLYSSVKADRRTEAETAFSNLTKHYLRIQPAIILSKKSEALKPVQSLLTMIKAQLRLNPYEMMELSMNIENLRKETNILFKREDQETLAPIYVPEQPILWTLLLGSIILLTLAYAAVRMYQSQQTTIKTRKKSGDRGWE
ncbi:sporulation protein YpjB [Paenibacillus sp. KN14-4R]|uniref:sporulation protein YpjB n=1 Tax=Paenibacillus sp. KN14-4R TaxID=3445773 RepID=UPI003F9F628E